MKPTKRQRQVVSAIEQLTAREGYPPTIREVADRLSTLPSNIHQILARLRLLGLVAWDPGRLRTLRVVK